MARVIITAEVEDTLAWENGFRTHGELFREYSATAVNFGTTDDNEVAILWEVSDLDKFLALTDSQETADAQAADGVKRDTIRRYVLDKAI